MWEFLSYLATIGSALSLFSLWDLITEKRTKHRISWYLFGYGSFTFNNFSSTLFDVFLNAFIRDGRVRKLRVFSISIFLFAVLMRENTYRFSSELMSSSFLALCLFPAMVLIGALVSFPFDIAQISFAKRLFYKRKLSDWQFSKRIFIYLVFSFLMVVPLLTISMGITVFWIILSSSIDASSELCRGISSVDEARELGIIGEENFWFSLGCISHIEGSANTVMSVGATRALAVEFFGMALVVSAISIIYVSVLLVLTLLSGLVLRHGLPKLAAYTIVLSQRSNIHEYPFSFIGVLLILIFECTRWLLS